MSGDSLLVVDVGTSAVRAAVVRPDGRVEHVRRSPLRSESPAPGLVEIDAGLIADGARSVAEASLADGGPVAGVGIANQRSTTVVWERATGEPVAPAIGWQDLRTVGTCLAMQAEGLRLAPNMTAPKVSAILDNVDPARARAGETLCCGTIDSWVAWTLSGGANGDALHVTDATNAGVTGLATTRNTANGPAHTPGNAASHGGASESAEGTEVLDWDPAVLEALGIPAEMLPVVVDSSGAVGPASALKGAPPICGIAGDQQASLVGQGCTRRGLAKVTFGTGGMLDLCTGASRLRATPSGPAGTFPIVAWQRRGVPTWGVEALMLTAGTCVDWLREDLGLLESAADSETVAAQCEETGDVWFVPALLGLGTPVWDYGARGTLVGMTRGTGRPALVRAVLEGIAWRGADLLGAAEADSGLSVEVLRVDGGMSANGVFLSALADATGRAIEVSPVLEATTLGAGYLAGLATGTWHDEVELEAAFVPSRTVQPSIDDEARDRLRARWLEARARSERTVPELSGISF